MSQGCQRQAAWRCSKNKQRSRKGENLLNESEVHNVRCEDGGGEEWCGDVKGEGLVWRAKTTRTKQDDETYERKLRDPIYSKVLSKMVRGSRTEPRLAGAVSGASLMRLQPV